MLTFEQKYEAMKIEVIKDIGEDKFNLIKEKIYYSKETDCFYLFSRGSNDDEKCSGGYEFYNARDNYLTTGFKNIASLYY